MPDNPLTLNPLDEDKFSLEFSRESLTNFVFSLLATPRQERRIYRTGFDLRLEDTKSLIDKIAHKIQTDHDILHNEFTADVSFTDETRLTYNSYEQFFTTSDVRNDEIQKLSMTLSVVIPFNRAEGEKSYEKQTIFVLVTAGQVGRVELDIRSTEISWAPGYFDIVEQHFKKMTRSIPTSKSPTLDRVFFLYPLFISDFIDEPEQERLSGAIQRGMSAFRGVIVFLTFFLFFRLLSGSGELEQFSVFNPDTGLIEKTEITLLIDDVGWEKAASMLRDTETLIKLNGAEYAEGSEPENVPPFIFRSYQMKVGLGAFFGIFLLVLSNLCYARIAAAALAGRIFLYNENLPDRAKGSLAFGIFGSLILGVIGSIISSGIMTF
ncbi:hypothetical protein [Thalassobius sp. I31.1]|uniref:hypothetical protein n=1 Tax=Thalassobius sp. I31.1 TaxID=2109912 RepID=UPI000D1B45C6|nr:hypothetical protein [Thalassobius sp. I31.1]